MVREISAKTVLRRHSHTDSWFLSVAGLNLYRGCGHDCAYCDGRSEKYRVAGEFAKDIEVKINAPELFRRELNPAGKRKPLKPGFICIGGGVGDSYQPLEEKYGLTRRILEIVHDAGRPAHVLTKSCLVERDFDILEKIGKQARAVLSMSFSTVNDGIARVFEPSASPPSLRLKTLSQAKAKGMLAGMYLMPVIPYVTDSPEMIEDCIRAATAHGVDFVIFGGMTLKPGRQTDDFMRVLQKIRPELPKRVGDLFHDPVWGGASREYYTGLNDAFSGIARRYRIPVRMPPAVYQDLLDTGDKVIVMLEHLDYLMRLENRKSDFSKAARALRDSPENFSELFGPVRRTAEISGPVYEMIREIAVTGTCSELENRLGSSLMI